jgi:hypothetical protein
MPLYLLLLGPSRCLPLLLLLLPQLLHPLPLLQQWRHQPLQQLRQWPVAMQPPASCIYTLLVPCEPCLHLLLADPDNIPTHSPGVQ